MENKKQKAIIRNDRMTANEIFVFRLYFYFTSLFITQKNKSIYESDNRHLSFVESI